MVETYRSDKLILGTAQLGLAYGIANQTPFMTDELAEQFLTESFELGVRFFDTAQAYGVSEERIGNFVKNSSHKIQVITKLPAKTNVEDSNELRKSVDLSVERLDGALHALLLHNPSHLDYWANLSREIKSRLLKGEIKQFGVSIYSKNEFERALDFDEVEIIQFPFNVFDLELYNSGLIDKALRLNKTLHIRSVMLQGLLTLPLEDAIAKAPFALKPIEAWHGILTDLRLQADELAVGLVCTLIPQASLVIGAEKKEQVKRNLNLVSQKPLSSDIVQRVMSVFDTVDEVTRDPRKWTAGS